MGFFFPGGPSPDSALPSHSKPIDTRHQAAASAMDMETHHHQGDDEMASQPASGPQPITPSDLPPQPSEHIATGLPRHPSSDEHAEIAPDVRVAAPNTEAAAEGSPSLGKEARHSTSVASRRTGRSLPANDVGEARGARVEEEPRQKATIRKEEYGVGRKVSKIEKRGAKVERTTLHIALQELAEIQGLQEASIKEEAVFHSLHSRALGDAHKAEMDLLSARTANEQGQASLRAADEVLEASRKHVRETTEMLRKKMWEVDRLRSYKKVDDKEHATKSPIRRRLSRILRSG